MTLIVYLAAYIPLALLRGWVIALLWGWYVTDYFGAATLTVVEGVGLGILASMFMARPPTEDDRQRGTLESILWGLLFPILALAFGWLWSFVR